MRKRFACALAVLLATGIAGAGVARGVELPTPERTEAGPYWCC